MVFFSCNACGDSLKKKKVEDHRRSGRCGADTTLSCIDCGVEFRGEEYAKHVSCISEADKYASKALTGSVKKDSNGNEKKNLKDEWVDALRIAIDSVNLKPSATAFLAPNMKGVPVKLKKFKNFWRNSSLRLHCTEDEAEAFFNAAQLELQKNKKPSNGENKRTKSVEEKQGGEDVKLTTKKKKKESKNSEGKEKGDEVVALTTTKKKKIGKDENSGSMSVEKKQGVEVVDVTTTTKKKRKKKRKRKLANDDSKVGDEDEALLVAMPKRKRGKQP